MNVLLLIFFFSIFYFQLSPSEGDKKLISRLGDFSVAQHLMDESKRFNIYGISSSPATPVRPSSQSKIQQPQQQQQPLQPVSSVIPQQQNSSSTTGSSGGNNSRPHHYHQNPPPRNNFLKPSDSKPPYNGRGGYPGQSVKHEVHTSSGIGPAKGPPPLPPPSIQQNGRTNDKQTNLSPIVPNGRLQPLIKPLSRLPVSFFFFV